MHPLSLSNKYPSSQKVMKVRMCNVYINARRKREQEKQKRERLVQSKADSVS